MTIYYSTEASVQIFLSEKKIVKLIRCTIFVIKIDMKAVCTRLNKNPK